MLGVAGSAAAVVAGVTPTQWQKFNKIFGSAESTGNTLMVDSQGGCSNVNDTLLPQSEAQIRTVPLGSELLGAYLFWSGSVTSSGPDTTADLTVADGTVFRNVAADQCQTVSRLGGYFYCRKDVSALVRPHPGSRSFNGSYLVGGVQAQTGICDPDGTCTTDPNCQAKYAGWSLILVWRDPLGNTARDVILYDGFLNLDETPNSPGVSRFSISGFQVGNPAVGEIAYFGLEGDAALGVPPQDINPDPSIACSTCYDYFAVNGTKLADQFGWPNNVFNSSTSNGIDLDKFNIGASGYNLIRPGDTSLSIEVGSGDGVAGPIPEPGGGGESFFLGWVLLSLDSLAPNFTKSRTFKAVDPTTAAVGDVLTYQIAVTNEGSLAATNVIVQDAIPANTTYIAGSTRVDNGAPLADVGGTSPLVAGLNLGTIDYQGTNTHQITFRVRVNGPLPSGVTEILNVATVRSTETPTPRELRASAAITQQTAAIGQATKAVVPLSGAQVKPGDTLLYTVTIPNVGQRVASAVQYADDMPKYVRGFRIVSINGGVDATTTFTPAPAGSNGRGRLVVNNLTIPAGGAATLSYSVTVDSVAEFAANGIALPDIDGKIIVNQGAITAPFLTATLVTDDPNTTPVADPTSVTIQYAPRVTVQKNVTDANGSPTEPGDLLTYELRFTNAGNLKATMTFTDDLPASLGTFQIGSCPTGASCNFAGSRFSVQNLVVGENGGTASIPFTVRVVDPIANGITIQNCAVFTVLEAPRQNGQSCSPTLTVTAVPVLSSSTKAVLDQNGGDVESGDALTYTLTLKNTGNQAANNVVVTDPIDTTNLEAVVPAQGGTFANSTITWDRNTTPALARLDRAGQVTLTFTARVKATVGSGTVISNQARIASTELPGPALTDDPATTTVGDATSVTVRTQPRFTTSTKTVRDENGGNVEPGDLLTYTVTVTNSGRGAAADVVVVDPVDTTALTAIAPGQGGTLANGSITWDKTSTPALAGVAAGTSVTLTFQARVVTPLENGRVISNQARLTSRELTTPTLTDDPTTPTASDPTSVTVRSAAIASTSTKSVLDQNGGAAQPGDVLTYTIVVKNTGNAPLRTVAVTDVIDAGLTSIVPAQGGRYDAASRTITWDSTSTLALARVVPGTDVTLTFTAIIAAGLADGTAISNQARISSADLASPAITDDPTTGAVGDATRITVVSRPDFVTSTKTFVDANGGTANPGDTINWTISVINSGAAAGNNVVVTDVVDANLTDLVIGQGGRYDAASRTLTWDAASTPALARLAAGAQQVLTFTSKLATPLDNGTVVRNQAQLRSTEVTTAQPTDDPSTPTRGDATQLTVASAADLSGSPKTVEDLNGGAVKPGDSLRYTLAVTNKGTAAATDVVVTDVVDANLDTVVPANGGRFDAASRTITWDRAALAGLARVVPGATNVVNLQFTARVKASLDNGTVIANQGRISSAGLATPVLTDDPRTADVNDSTKVTVVSGADFSNTTLAVRDENGGAAEPNDFLTYTLTVINSGDGPGLNVVATAPVDANLTDVVPSTGGVFNAAARTVTWSSPGVAALARLDAGAQTVLTFRARIVTPLDNGTVLSEQARITATGLVTPVPSDDPTTSALDDATKLTVVARSGFGAIMTVTDDNGGQVVPGDVLTYTLTVTNTGTAPLRNVTVQSPIVPNTQLTELLDGAANNNGLITWTPTTTPALALVAPGVPAVVRVRLSVVIPTANGTVIANQGLVSPQGLTAQRTDDPSTPTLGDSTNVTVVSAANLSRSIKSVVDVNGGAIEPGDDLQYVITVRNDGTDNARTLLVTDVLDPNLTAVVPQDGGTFDAATRTVTWTSTTTPALATLRPAEQVLLRINAKLASPLDNGTIVRNQARIVTPSLPQPVLTDNPATPAVGDSTDITVVSAPNFSETTKAVLDENGGLLRIGDRLLYTIVVKNTGKSAGRDVVVRDAAPAQLGTLEAGQGGRVTGQNVEWNGTTTPALAILAPGASTTLTLRGSVLAATPNGTAIRNQAFVTSREVTTGVGSDDPATPARGDATLITLATPDFSKSTLDYLDENGGDVNPGDRVTYTLLVRNTGARDATSVVVSDAIDPNLTEVTADNGGRIANGVITWSPQTTPALALVAQNGVVTLTVRARVKELLRNGVVVRNQAQLGHADDPALTPSDNPRTASIPADSTDFTIIASPNLKPFYKGVVDENGGDVQPGDFLTYTLRVRNSGTTFATNVVVTDPLDAALTEVAPAQGGVLNGRTITWDSRTTPALAQLNPGVEVALTFRARVSAMATHNQQIRNQASARAEETPAAVVSDDPATLQTPDDPTMVTVVANPVFTETTKAVRDDNGGNVEPGDTLTYTVVVKNSGARDGERVTYNDPVPTGTVYVVGSTKLNGTAVSDGTGGLAPFSAGMLVASPNAPPGTVRVRQDATITYQLRVLASVASGTVLQNQGAVTSSLTGPVLTDNPATPEVDDPTSVIVGVGPNLKSTQMTVRIALDQGTPGVAEVGDVLEYRVTIPNDGNAQATGVVFTLPLPDRTSFVPGSITYNGVALSDGVDADPGELLAAAGTSPAQVRVRVGDLAARGRAVLTFRAKVEAGPLITAQGDVTSTQTALEKTDADGNDLNGNQPTVTPVGTAPVPALDVTKEALDVNGGSVQPGDLIEYSLNFRNTGNTRFTDLGFEDDLPAGMVFAAGSPSQFPGATVAFDPPPAGASQRGKLRVSNLALDVGRELRFVFRASVASSTPCGTKIENVARYSATGTTPTLTNKKAFLVCGGLGTAAVRGVVFQDRGRRDKLLGADDYRLSGFQVLAYHAERPASPVRTSVSGDDGAFSLFDLPPGLYTLKAYSNTGTEFAKLENLRVLEGAMLEQNVLIDPRGIVYDSTTGNALEGVTAYLYFDDTNALDPGKLVPPEFLGERQQAQRTNTQGMYQFDARAGHRYKLQLVPAGQGFVFPSTLIAPKAGFAEVTPPDYTVVPSARPDRSGPTTYYLRFNLQTSADAVFNNHVPLDPVTSLIRIDKRANKRVVTMGGIVSYTVKVQNQSSRDFVVDAARGLTALYVQDLLPKGFKYLKGSARANRVELQNGRSTETRLATGETGPTGFSVDPSGATGRALRFGPYEVKAGETIVVRYQTVVGVTVGQGEYRNRAVVQGPGNVNLSGEAEALVQVVRDGIFDQGVLLGKVFCDRNGNGVQDAPGPDTKPEDREDGIAGARVYIDTGWYAETGDDGKYHLKDIDPGTHLIKVDPETLPPGSTFTTDERRVLYVTRGLPSKVDFGIRCTSERAGITSLQVKTLRVPAKRPESRIRIVKGNLAQWTVEVGGRPLPLWKADVLVSQGPPGFGAPRGVLNAVSEKGRLKEPLRFELRTPAGAAIESWLVRLADAKGETVHELGGRGVPPREVSWDGTDAGAYLLEDGGLYRYQLFVVGQGGAQAISPRHSFGVAYGTRSPGKTAHTARQETVSGQPFVRIKTLRPSKELLKKAQEMVGRLRAEPSLTLELEVHTDDRGSRLSSLLLSQRQGVALRSRLVSEFKVDPKRVSVRGFGARQPSIQSASKAARDKNRRVVFRLVRPGAEGVFTPLPVPSTLTALGDRVVIGDVEVPLGKDGTFERAVVLPPDGVIPIELQRADGRAVVWYREGEAPSSRVDVPVSGDVGARTLQLGAHSLPLPGLGLGLSTPLPKVTLPAKGAVAPLTFTLVGERFPVAAWSLEVERLGGQVFIARRGEAGFLPAATGWDGTLEGRAALPVGLYRARLVASDPRGVRYASAPAEWEVVAEAVKVPPAAAKPALDSEKKAKGKKAAKAVKAAKPKKAKLAVEQTLAGSLFKGGRSDTVTAGLKRALNTLAKKLLKLLKDKPQQRFEILAHTDDSGAAEADVAVTEAQGEAIRTGLKERKVPAAALTLRTFGGKEPLGPSKNARQKAKNRRLIVRSVEEGAETPSLFGTPTSAPPRPEAAGVLPPPAKVEPPLARWPASFASVSVGGTRVLLDSSGRFRTALQLQKGEPVVVDITAQNGARAFVIVPYTETAAAPPAQSLVPASPTAVPTAPIPAAPTVFAPARPFNAPAPATPAARPAEVSQPLVAPPSAQPVAPVKAVEPPRTFVPALPPAAKPDGPAKAVIPAKTVGPAQPVNPAKPGDPAKPVDSASGVEPVKAGIPAKPAELPPPAKKTPGPDEKPADKPEEKPVVPPPPAFGPPAKRISGDATSSWLASAWTMPEFRVSTRSGEALQTGSVGAEASRTASGSLRSAAQFSGGETTMRPRAGGTGLFSASAPSLVAQAMPAKDKQPEAAEKAGAAAPGTAKAEAAREKEEPVVPPRSGSFGGFGDAEVEAVFSGAELQKLPPVNAAKLNANLPPKGILIKVRELTLTGDTHPDNKLTVNGQEVKLEKDGRFRTVVKLTIGKSNLVLRTVDKAGNVGLLDWPIEVSSWSLFVLALGEGVIGQNGVHLDGGTATTRTEFADKMFLQGRTAVYVKGRIQGKWLFEDIKFTAHFDSAKRKEFEQVFSQVIDPEKFYPVYGDTAKEVKDVNSRDKLYVLVEADASKLLIGNFKSQIEGVELFSYDRAFYGLSLDFKKAFVKGYDTGVKLFASKDGEIQQHAHVELRGTGGSIYYLKHEELLEGSEKVKVVVRDRDTGMELYSTPRSLYSDYTVEYRQGRILLKSTLPSVADASFIVNNNLSSITNGHPVYLVIDYEYQGRSLQSGNTFGVHVRQKIADIVEIGGGHIREGRPGNNNPDYTLTGAHVKVEKNNLFVKGEFARSSAVDAQNYISDDGGLTYANLGNRWDTNKAKQGAGNAFKFEAGGDIGKAAGWKDTGLKVRAYVQQMDAGFFSTGKMQDQGQTRFGATVSYKPTEKDELVLRHDGLTAEIYDSGDMARAARRSSRAISTAQYTRKEGKWTFLGEYNHTLITDDTLGGGALSDSIGFGATYDWSKRIQLLGRIDAFPRANDRSFVQNGQVGVSPTPPASGDHVGVTVGARLGLTESTSIQITETVRGSGENATNIGLKTKLSDTANLYVEERLLSRDSRVMGTTVLGGEQKVGKESRAYGEYQLDNGVEGNRNRAVMGAGHRFKVAKGLNIDVGYERSQTFGDALGGQSSRDAVSSAYEYLREKWLKASGRYELRYDNGDEKVGGQDKLQVLTANLVDFTATKDLSFLLKLNYSNTDNRTLAQTEAELLEMSMGFSVRPREWNWFNLLTKYTKFVEQRPTALLDNGGQRVSSDILAVIPIFDLPKGFQIVEKFAYKREREYFVDLPAGLSDTFLWVNRLNYHLTGWADVSGEYRFLTNLASGDTEHGFLFEASIILQKYLRLGLGYNFTRFSDDELVRNRIDNRGVFFRVVGMY